jgi:predicted HicB family RNase H-like nuclease
MVSLVRFVFNDMEETGEEAPVPFSKREYSGSLRLRLPKEQHRRIALEAAEQGVSMNQLIVSRI